jgi:hypothetical protein
MIMERGARPDALPKPKRAKTALIGMVGVGVGLALGLGLGLGANFALVGAFGTKRVLAAMASPERVSGRERFLQCSTSQYDDAPGPEELDEIAVRSRARYAEPHWGVP